MAATIKLNCQLAMIFLILLRFQAATGFKFLKTKPSEARPIENQVQGTLNAELMALVRPIPSDPSGTFTHALELLASIQTSPSCNRVAASTLLDSCHSIEASERDVEASIEDFRSIYAAQLAMCEIGSANSIRPQSCEVLATAAGVKSKSSKHIRKDQLSQCLQSLESRPQWWTSYSNNRQNAGVMCQAARMDIEKDQLIRLHKSMVKTSADASTALATATVEANAALVQLQSDFTLAKRTFQEQLMQDLDVSTEKAQSYIGRMVASMDAAVQTAMSNLVSATRKVESETAHLSQNVQQANSDAVDLRENVGKIFHQVVEGGAELAAAQTQQWDKGHELASQLQSSLQDMKNAEVNTLLSAIHGINYQLQTSNELVSSLHDRQSALDKQMLKLGNSFIGLESKAETFHAAQTRQAEVQTRLHDQMQVEMQTTRGLLDEVTFSATTLKATVDSTAAIIGRLATLTDITSWIPAAALGIVLLIALHLVNPRYLGYLGMAFVFSLCIYFSGVLELFASVSTNVSLIRSTMVHKVGPHVIGGRAAAVFCSVLCSIAILYKVFTWLMSRNPRKLRSASDLPIREKGPLNRTHRSYIVWG